jgi:hypothetical protein
VLVRSRRPAPSGAETAGPAHALAQRPTLAALELGQASGRPVAAPSAGNRRSRCVLAAEHAAPQQAWASNGTQPKAASSLGVLRPGRRCRSASRSRSTAAAGPIRFESSLCTCHLIPAHLFKLIDGHKLQGLRNLWFGKLQDIDGRGLMKVCIHVFLTRRT